MVSEMVERLSLSDNTLLSNFGDHIQRYRFAESYCVGKDVLDAGCGIGYGSHYLALNGAKSVRALDISADAISEASQTFIRNNLTFQLADVHDLGKMTQTYDVIVNFENLEHLSRPETFVAGASAISRTLITSTPNGELTQLSQNGKPLNPYHVKEFTAVEFTSLLSAKFSKVEVFGQWLTHAGRLHQLRSKQLFDHLNDLYYNPMSRIGRCVRAVFGKSNMAASNGSMLMDSVDGDYEIAPLSDERFPWKPTTLIAVCVNY